MDMKWIKDRERFIRESQELKHDALHILASNDDGQSSDVKTTLDKLDNVHPKGKVVTRFAPSPTGFLHIGGIRTALYNYLFAKQNDGIFYVRIEDTDSKRFVSEAEEYIKNALDWCGISPDYAPWKPGPHGPYRQSERDYSKETQILLDKGMAYYAFDTESELTKAREATPNFAYSYQTRMSMRNSLSLSKEEVDQLISSKTPYVIRFKTPENKVVVVDDIIRGRVEMNTAQVDDKVLVKSNGIPTYHMANVCDDHNMETTHVIRGDEWLPSAPLHLMLYEAFGWTPPQFAHLPVILNPDGRGKLSKRKALTMGIPAFPFGGKGVDDKGKEVEYKGFKDEGYESDALMNFLLMLGWTPKDNKEMLSMADMISEFDLTSVHKAGARYDIDKAKFFNTQYIGQKRSDEELLKHIDLGNTNYSSENISKIIELAKKRSTFTKDMQVIVDIFTKPVTLTDKEKSTITQDFKDVMKDFIEFNYTLNDPWTGESIKELIFKLCEQRKIKMGKIMPSLRMALTKNVPGPDLMTTAEILGKTEFLKRLKQAI